MFRKTAVEAQLDQINTKAQIRSEARAQVDKAARYSGKNAASDISRGRDIGILAIIPFAFVVAGGIAYGNIGPNEFLTPISFPGLGWIMGIVIFYCGLVVPAKATRWPFLFGLIVMIYPAIQTAPTILSWAGIHDNPTNTIITVSGFLLIWFGVLAWSRSLQKL